MKTTTLQLVLFDFLNQHHKMLTNRAKGGFRELPAILGPTFVVDAAGRVESEWRVDTGARGWDDNYQPINPKWKKLGYLIRNCDEGFRLS